MRFVTVVLAAMLSAYLFMSADRLWAAPGAIFSIAIIIYVLYKKYPVKAWPLTGYFFCMNVVYIALFISTRDSVFVGLILGIFTAGFGSMATFYLTRQFVCDTISYKGWPVFLAGSSVFVFNLLVMYMYSLNIDEIITLMSSIIFLWQVVIGLYLTNAIDNGFMQVDKTGDTRT